VYTKQSLKLDRDVQWPDWCSDIPEPGSAFAPRMPVCMVHAQGDDHETVQALVQARREIILSLVQQQAA
jgi:predicted ATP-grasp superfamily ATP-dependent carboligase